MYNHILFNIFILFSNPKCLELNNKMYNFAESVVCLGLFSRNVFEEELNTT